MEPKDIKVLAWFEESQAVCQEFVKRGFDAYSSDIIDCSGPHPERHIKKDATLLRIMLYKSNCDVVQIQGDKDPERFDLVISFPPCTDLAVSGARHFAKKRLSGEQEASIELFFHTWYYSHATENPIGIMNNGGYIKKWFPHLYQRLVDNKFPFKPTQIIQPWQFGHGETKATCLWLKNLPMLKPTDVVSGREQRIWKMAPGPDRQKLRSKTYPGIAKAMADQWGDYLLNKLAVTEKQTLFD